MSWDVWWVWAAGALVLGIIEIIAPAYIFLGFAIGAGVISVILLFTTSITLPTLLVIFAVVSIVAWIVLRRALGVQKHQVKTFDHDINQ